MPPDSQADPNSMPPPQTTNAHHSSSSRRSSFQPFPPLSPAPMADNTLPVRHPRPLTAAELHSELEKEQEGMVRYLVKNLDYI